jgi:hypothetical protein
MRLSLTGKALLRSAGLTIYPMTTVDSGSAPQFLMEHNYFRTGGSFSTLSTCELSADLPARRTASRVTVSTPLAVLQALARRPRMKSLYRQNYFTAGTHFWLDHQIRTLGNT